MTQEIQFRYVNGKIIPIGAPGEGGPGRNSAANIEGLRAIREAHGEGKPGSSSISPAEEKFRAHIEKQQRLLWTDKEVGQYGTPPGHVDFKLDTPRVKRTDAEIREFSKTFEESLAKNTSDRAIWQKYLEARREDPKSRHYFYGKDRVKFTEHENAVADLMGAFAVPGYGRDPRNVVIRDAINDLFGTTHHAPSAWTRELSQKAHSEWGKHSDAFALFASHMYENTQTLLEKKGVKGLVLFRGHAWDYEKQTLPSGVDFKRGNVIVPIQTQSVSSHTLDPHTALRFAADLRPESVTIHHAISVVKVPREEVLSVPHTGWGWHDEMEVTLIGGTRRAKVHSWTGDNYTRRVDPIGVLFR